MIGLSERNERRLIQRVRQIVTEFDIESIEDYKEMPLDTLAFRLKEIAIQNKCSIKSWLLEGGDAIAKTYNNRLYEKEDEDTWELCSSGYEPIAICVAFKWLVDKHYIEKN
jgi:hypothetical protein